MSENYNTIKKCRICYARDLKIILDLGSQPPANSLNIVGKPPVDTVPLVLIFCMNCSSLQLRDSISPQALFSDYVWVTGTSEVARKYSQDFAHNVLSIAKIENPRIIEIASNDGTFLKVFKDKGCDILGIDPANNVAQLAIADGIPTIIEFFSSQVATKLKSELDPERTNIIIARNVIPHVPDIHSVIEGIKTIIGEDGVGVIEFHNSGLLMKELQYDYIYHEHVFYFTLNSMKQTLEMYDLEIFDVFDSPISGGSFVVLFKNKSKKINLGEGVINILSEERSSGANDFNAWKKFAEGCKNHRLKTRALIKNLNGKAVGYGASARSSTILNYCGLNCNDIRYIIDKNPLKRNKLTAGSNIEIMSFSDGIANINPDDTIIILAWNFKEEITEQLRSNGIANDILTLLPYKTKKYEI